MDVAQLRRHVTAVRAERPRQVAWSRWVMSQRRVKSFDGLRAVLRDSVVALLLLALFTTIWLVNPTEPSSDQRWAGWEGYVAGALATLPVALRRRAPTVGLLLVAAGVSASALLGGVSDPTLMMAALVAIFSVGVYGRSDHRAVISLGAVTAMPAATAWVLLFGDELLRPPAVRLVSSLHVASEAMADGGVQS